MKVFHAQYFDKDSDTAEDVLVAQFLDSREQVTYNAHVMLAGIEEWVKRNLQDYDLTDDDIFYYLDPPFVPCRYYTENAEIENLLEDGDMLVIGKEF